MLGEGSNLGVDGRELGAEDALEADLAGVALDGAEDERVRHAVDVALRLRVGKRAVSDTSLQAVRAALHIKSPVSIRYMHQTAAIRSAYREVTEAVLRRGVAEERKDGVDDAVGVVLLEERVDDAQLRFMTVF